MPKKSKKEKILADLRRRVLTKEPVAPVQTPNPQQSSELTAIKRDLYKTCILATLAIAAEVIIYWFRR
jgi:hypothetical protein